MTQETKPKKERVKLKGNSLREKLLEINMTQQELADLVGTNKTHIYKIVSNRNPGVTLTIALKIAKVLNSRVEDLFFID